MAGHRGMLEQLQRLEQSAEQRAAEREEAEQSAERLLQLQAAVQRLRAQRDLLRDTVTARPAGRLQDILDRTGSQPSALLSQEQLTRTVTEEQLNGLHRILQAYQLTGIGAQVMDSSTAYTFCISTAFDNIYLDSFYLDIQLQRPRKVLRHSVPAFIPVEQTARAFLQQDLARFLETMHQALNAYVSRRYQLEQLQERHASYLSQTQSNAACSLLKFHYPICCGDVDQSVLVKLVYEDSASCLPTDVTLTCTGAAAESVLEKLECHWQLFLHQHLHRALDCIKLQEEQVLSYGSPQQHVAQPLPLPGEGH